MRFEGDEGGGVFSTSKYVDSGACMIASFAAVALEMVDCCVRAALIELESLFFVKDERPKPSPILCR